MFCRARQVRPAVFAGLLSGCVLLASPTSAEAQPMFGRPDAPQVTITRIPRGPDRGFDIIARGPGANLLNIGQLILAITRDILGLIGFGRGRLIDGPTLRDFELLRRLAEMRRGTGQRRIVQMAQVFDQTVDDLVRQDQQLGRDPTRAEAEERARLADEKIELNRTQFDQQALRLPPGTEAAPGATAATSTPAGQVDENDLKAVLQTIDAPSSVAESRSGRSAPTNADLLDEFTATTLREQTSGPDKEDVPWIKSAGTQAEEKLVVKPVSAESDAQRQWRLRRVSLQEELLDSDRRVDGAWRTFNSGPNETARGEYDEAVTARDAAQQSLSEHLKAEPPGSGT